jgi:hypothetical protein
LLVLVKAIDMSSTGRSRDTLLCLAVPALLCVVAAAQLYLVERSALSRWKGGGFGMFSTVDSPSARFLRVYLMTDAGEVPVLVPGEVKKLAQKVRVMPSERRVEELTETLRNGAWVHLTVVSAAQHYHDLLRSAGEGYQDSADDIQLQTQGGPGRIDFEEMELVRMLGEDEGPSDDQPLVVTGARVEVWRYLFDREALVLRTHKLAEHASGDDGD